MEINNNSKWKNTKSLKFALLGAKKHTEKPRATSEQKFASQIGAHRTNSWIDCCNMICFAKKEQNMVMMMDEEGTSGNTMMLTMSWRRGKSDQRTNQRRQEEVRRTRGQTRDERTGRRAWDETECENWEASTKGQWRRRQWDSAFMEAGRSE